jgi:hypothetical protein
MKEGQVTRRPHVCAIPKGEQATCLDCDVVFSIRARTCPTCASENVVLVEWRHVQTAYLPFKGEIPYKEKVRCGVQHPDPDPHRRQPQRRRQGAARTVDP